MKNFKFVLVLYQWQFSPKSVDSIHVDYERNQKTYKINEQMTPNRKQCRYTRNNWWLPGRDVAEGGSDESEMDKQGQMHW